MTVSTTFPHTLPAHASVPPCPLRPVRLGDWCAYSSHHAEDAREPARVLRVIGEEGRGKAYVADEDGARVRDLGLGGCCNATLFVRIPEAYADDEQARRAYAAGYADGRHGLPYLRDPRGASSCVSVWALSRLAYRAGFRRGDPKRRPVAVVQLMRRRERVAAEVRRIGSLPRAVDRAEKARPELRDKVRAMLRDARDRAHRAAPPKPSADAFAAVLAHFREGARAFRADCPQVCGADDSHLERLDRWRDDAADAAEAWAWYRSQPGSEAATFYDLTSRYAFPCDDPSGTGAAITPEAYADRLETHDAAAPALGGAL